MGGVVCVAESLDNGWQEERETVQRGVDAKRILAATRLCNRIHALPNSDEHVDPDLPVFDSLPEVLHAKLVGERAAVIFQATTDFPLLILVEELGSGWVIIEVEESDNGWRDG